MLKKYGPSVALILFAVIITIWVVEIVMELRGEKPQKQVAVVREEAVFKYGINLNDFKVLNHLVKPNELFSEIFSQYNVTAGAINYFVSKSGEVFNLKKIKAGNSFTVLCEKNDSLMIPKMLVYEESKVNYVVFNLDDSL